MLLSATMIETAPAHALRDADRAPHVVKSDPASGTPAAGEVIGALAGDCKRRPAPTPIGSPRVDCAFIL